MAFIEPEHDGDDFYEVTQKVRLMLEDLGLYWEDLSQLMIQSDDETVTSDPDKMRNLKKFLDEGHTLRIQVPVRVGKLAYSDRVLYPEKADADHQFKVAAPTEGELFLQELRDNIAKGNILGDDDDEEDTNGLV